MIPKIKLSFKDKREKINLSADCSTTANIGFVQPTYCREIVPHSKVKIGVESLVRLAPMPVPTLGRISYRHYHVFVPMLDICPQFNSFMACLPYQTTGQNTYYPTKMHRFKAGELAADIISNYSYYSVFKQDDTDGQWKPILMNDDISDETTEQGLIDLKAFWTCINNQSSMFDNTTGGFGLNNLGFGSMADDDRGCLLCGTWFLQANNSAPASGLAFRTPNNPTGNVVHRDSAAGVPTDGLPSYISLEGADYISKYSYTSGNTTYNYAIAFRLKSPAKRLRSIMIGLGYQFSPFSNVECNYLKLLAFYKAWFDLFMTSRTISWQDTYCYKLLKYNAQFDGTLVSISDVTFRSFILSLMNDCYYYLPMDYYSMSVVKPGQRYDGSNYNGNQINMYAHYANGVRANDNDNTTYVNDNEHVTLTAYDSSNNDPVVKVRSSATWISPGVLDLAKKILRYSNKNSIIGHSVRDFMRVHFGITTDIDEVDRKVNVFGSSRVPVKIGDVMSMADTGADTLGSYAGKGYGYKDAEHFNFESDGFGYLLTLSVIVPESGMYQGYMKENRHFIREEFFTPEFDALGYQVLERGEVFDDYSVSFPNSSFDPTYGTYSRKAGFGFVPRYSEYKVGRNVVNGDLTLRSLRNEYNGYFLDRQFPDTELSTIAYNVPNSTEIKHQLTVQRPTFVPSIVFDGFRKIDPTDSIGNYNRMFYYTNNDLDHFIIHNAFDVEVIAPMKSLATSFDTISSDEDGIVDVEHA